MGTVESPDLTMGGGGGLLTHTSLGARTTKWGVGGEALWSRLEEPGEFGTLISCTDWSILTRVEVIS